MAFGLFKKKKKEEKKDTRYKKLRVKEVRNVAKDAVNVVFEKPDENFAYQPGQFITIIDTVGDKKIRRAYSLCTTPYLDEYPAVTVKRVEGGAMSNFVNDTYKAGNEVEIMEPMGMFTTQYNAENKRKSVFFGGGSGITPLYAIIRTILNEEPNSEVSLVYGNRSEDFIIFKEELAELAEKHTNFHLKHILESDTSSFSDYQGRPTAEKIAEMAGELNIDDDTEIFICGPQPMMDVVQAGLKLKGVGDANIMLESFEAGKTSPEEIIDKQETNASSSSAEATIIIDDERFSITLEKDRPVLEQGLEQGLDMPYSCQSGLCTACRGKCIEGELSTDDAEGLSQDELDEGYVLTCIGKPLSDRVVIEIG